MLELYSHFFKQLEHKSVLYCSWKNNHVLSNELNGEGDIDLLINPLQRHLFENIINKCNFIPVKSPISEYPYIQHYYGYDEISKKLAHIHVYFKLITGDSHLKNYRFPVEKQVLESADYFGEDIKQAAPEHQQELYLIRKQIKSSSLLGIFLLFKESHDYKEEYIYISKLLDEHTNSLLKALFNYSISSLKKSYKIPLLKFYVGTWNRGSGFIDRISQLFKRILNKLLFRRKKSINGSLIAIVGLDGTGKTTAVEMIKLWLGKEFTVKVFHFGRPPTTWLTWPVRFALLIRSKIGISKPVASLIDTSKMQNFGLVGKLRYLVLAYERRTLIGRAHKFAMQGGLAILDRYPSLNIGKMDSQRIIVKNDTNTKFSWGGIESLLYNTMFVADLVIQLNADVDIAVERNNKRNKKGKETEEEIRIRYQLNNHLEYKSLSFVKLNANQQIDRIHRQLRNEVWNHIVTTN